VREEKHSKAECLVNRMSFDLTFDSRDSTYAILEYLGGLVGAATFC